MSDTPATPEQHRLVAEAIKARMKREIPVPGANPDFDEKVADALARIEQEERAYELARLGQDLQPQFYDAH